MRTSYRFGNRREYKSNLDIDAMELDAAAERLKNAFQVDPEPDEEVERRILAKVEGKRSQSAPSAPRWGRPLKIAIAGGLMTAVLGTVLLTQGIRISSRNQWASGDNPAISTDLPVVGSYAKLKMLVANAQAGVYKTQSAMEGSAAPDAAYSTVDMPLESASTDYSKTNVQVQGVDEADIVKTDGTNIYQVSGDRIVVARVYPSDRMKVLSTIPYKPEEFSPIELYVDDERLVVIGHSSRVVGRVPLQQPEGESMKPNGRYVPPYDYRTSTVKVFVYDLSDKAKPVKLREAEIDGNYVSSRKVGSALYLVANKHIDVYLIQMEPTETAPRSDYLKPGYRDSAANAGFRTIDYSEIRYFPKSSESTYLMVASLDIEKPNREMQVSTYLGAGQHVYASTENLYVAATAYEMSERPSYTTPATASTNLYRFSLNEGRIAYRAKGKIPGALLNQFSMDEHKDYLRVATTVGEVWAEGEATAKNNVYVLNKDMTITGKLENVARGERIYSTRFIGDRAYMVTFKKVDPLFVLDLAEPRSPKILGELKIPGYSDYLHPYDENHIIGFGKDAIEAPDSSPSSFAYYQGMKIAVFDVSDVKHPVEKFKTTIGDRGTESPLLHNHKALLFDKEKNLLAFPVTVVEIKNKPAGGNESFQPGVFPVYDYVFQGAYVYNISLDKGLELKGRITHVPEGTKFAQIDGYSMPIERVLYIGDDLYTVSKGFIKASALADLREKNNLVIESR